MLRIEGLKLRVYALGCRGFRVHALGCRASGVCGQGLKVFRFSSQVGFSIARSSELDRSFTHRKAVQHEKCASPVRAPFNTPTLPP